MKNYEDVIFLKAVTKAWGLALIEGLSLVLLLKDFWKNMEMLYTIIVTAIILCFAILTYLKMYRHGIYAEKRKIRIRKVQKKLIPGVFIKVVPKIKCRKAGSDKEYFAKLIKKGQKVEIHIKEQYNDYIFSEVIKLKKFVEKYRIVDLIENLNEESN